MAREQKTNKDEDSALGGLDYEVPDNSDLMQRLENARVTELQREHTEFMDEEDAEEKKKGNKPKKRKARSGVICCCGNPVCRIGPFTNTEGKEDAA